MSGGIEEMYEEETLYKKKEWSTSQWLEAILEIEKIIKLAKENNDNKPG